MNVSENFCREECNFCEKSRKVKGHLFKNNFLADLLESKYLFEIDYTSLTIKNDANLVKSGSY